VRVAILPPTKPATLDPTTVAPLTLLAGSRRRLPEEPMIAAGRIPWMLDTCAPAAVTVTALTDRPNYEADKFVHCVNYL
jgi:hypothetical protein